MSFDHADGEISAVYRQLATVPDLTGPTASTTFLAPGSMTRRQFGLFRRDMQPHAGGPDAHIHRTDFLYVPKSGIHAFKADSDEPSSMLILFAPGKARERFFREMEEIRASGRTLTDAQWTELYARHDQYMV